MPNKIFIMRADFYIINNTNTVDFACRLLAKAQQQQKRVYVQTDSHQMTRELDQRLWTFKDISFIPHAQYESGCEEAIQIGHQETMDTRFDILVNLSQDIPTFYQQFQRIIEIVPNDPQAKVLNREHYRFYRDHDFELKINH